MSMARTGRELYQQSIVLKGVRVKQLTIGSLRNNELHR
jgi:hypothetical protein